MDDEFKTKLQGWSRITIADMKPQDHIRVTKNNYRAPGRTCSYLVIQKIKDGEVFVNNYKERKFNDWKLRPTCPFRQERYWRNNTTLEHTGFCIKCTSEKVEPPYYVCTWCKYNT